MTSLIKYDAARHALQQAVEIDEVKDIRDKAQAMAAYAKQANDTKLIEWATEIKIRAERKAGQMLAEMDKNRGSMGSGSNQHEVRSLDVTAPKLSDLGISKNQSSRWQKLAAVPDNQFEQAIVAAKEVAGEVTTAAMLRIEKEIRKSTHQQDTSNIGKAQQKKESDVKPKALKKISPEKQELKVVESDFQEESDYDPEQDQINELSHTINDLQEENEKLRSALAINQIPEGLEIEDADTIIDTLRARVKQLEIEVKAITQSRDTYLRENSQLKEQIRRQAAQLKKLGGKASA